MTYFKWISDGRAMDADASSKMIVPLWKCTAKGGPENCKYHARFVKGTNQWKKENEIREKGDVADVLSATDGIRPLVWDLSENATDRKTGVFFSDDMRSGLRRVSKAVTDGAIAPARLPVDLLKEGTVDGIPPWLMDFYTYLSATSEDYDGFDEDDPEVLSINQYEDAVIQEYAERIGVWTDSAIGTARKELGGTLKKLGSGQESIVYDAGDSVVKLLKVADFRKSMLHTIESIILFNYYFPESAQEVIGIGKCYGKTAFILGQRKFDLDKNEPSEAEAVAFMKDRGFDPIDPDKPRSYTSEDCTIDVHDLHTGNIRKTVDGRMVVVDAYPELSTDFVGGIYDINNPPKKIFRTKKTENERKKVKAMRKRNAIAVQDEAADNHPLKIGYPKNPLPNNPYYDPELIAELDSRPPCSFEHAREMANLPWVLEAERKAHQGGRFCSAEENEKRRLAYLKKKYPEQFPEYERLYRIDRDKASEYYDKHMRPTIFEAVEELKRIREEFKRRKAAGLIKKKERPRK